MDKQILYILTSLEAIEKIKIYSEEFDNANEFFEANEQMNFNACYTLLLTISEESRKLEGSIINMYPNIPWKLIFGIRNHLSHNYRGIDNEIIFDIINTYLPPLKETLIKILNHLNLDKKKLIEIINSKYYRHLKYLL